MSIIGLLIILSSWFAQYIHHLRKPQQLSPVFLLGYSMGTFLLVMDGIERSIVIPALLNMAILIVVGMILSIIKKPE